MDVTEQSSLSVRLQEIVEAQIRGASSIPVIGLSGPQGSGKSTALRVLLKQSQFNIAGLGLDDFYLPNAERQLLAQTISPLFETRGPPGTHDLVLLHKKLDELLNASPKTQCAIPKFDKLSDDRLELEDWTVVNGKPDIIIIEGWMVGGVPPPDFLTSPPLNDVERSDVDETWRRTQYEALMGPYQDLWNRVNIFVHIDGPGFDAVLDWRLEQEASNVGVTSAQLPQARRKWVVNFVDYFQRLTMFMHQGYRRGGITLRIDADRRFLE